MQMNSEERQGSQQQTYSGYAGEYMAAGQKLEDDGDEQFADMLARRIRQDMHNESSTNQFVHQRFLLAMLSLCAVVILFTLLVAALVFGHVSGDAAAGLGWSMFLICATIMAVNGYFNSASKEIHRQDDKSGKKAKE